MNFAGFIKNSFVDYPNNIASVVFTFGCNFNCWYCHNRKIIEGNQIEIVSEKEVIDFLSKRKGMIDGVVVSGGEPTINPNIEEFITKIKEMGFKVKLDTNGTNPELLEKLINKKLLDFVAMDIKTSLNKYETITKCKVDLNKIKQSINILKNSGVDYEFRTTFSPDISVGDIEDICKNYIFGAKSYAIQKYNPPNESIITIPHSKDDFNNALLVAKKYVNNAFLRSCD